MNELQIYVDGSYSPDANVYGYGVVVVKNNEVIDEISGCGNDVDVALLRNVSGEMIGAMKGILYAKKNNYKSVDLFYDYAGIQKWADEDWKAKKQLTRLYRQFMAEYKSQIDISFIKVEAHTGVKYNEMADMLAKNAIFDFISKSGGEVYYD